MREEGEVGGTGKEGGREGARERERERYASAVKRDDRGWGGMRERSSEPT